MVLVICMLLESVFAIAPVNAKAATKDIDAVDCSTVFDNVLEGKAVKCGNYYLKYKSYREKDYITYNTSVYISTKKNGKYKKIPNCNTKQICSDGKVIYFVNNKVIGKRSDGFSKKSHVLYKYTMATGKIKRIKTLSDKIKDVTWIGGGVFDYTVSYVYGDMVFMTIEDEWPDATYVYNMKSRRFYEMKSGNGSTGTIEAAHGKYIITMDEFHSDRQASSYSLWKITSKGVVKKTKLASYSYGNFVVNSKISAPKSPFFFADDYVYYTCWENIEGGALKYYRCSLKNFSKKKLGVNRKVNAAETRIHRMNSKYCIYSVCTVTYGKKVHYKYSYYKYTFATKKVTAVKNINAYR